MPGIVKILDYSPVHDTGEPTIQFIHPSFRTTKLASAVWAPAIQEFIASLKPVKDKLYALINAMGASEFYGCNKNGDAFYEDVLKKYHPTFVEHGHPYTHHVNKDPNKCFGKVVLSDYNDLMHRVELVIEYDLNKLDRKYVERINNGDMVNVSMGCRVPYDICSICGNRAKTPTEYCSCLKSDPGLGRMKSDGRRAFAINTEPEFFDISIVTIPADPTARIMAKLAHNQVTKRVFSFQRAMEELSSEKVAMIETCDDSGLGAEDQDQEMSDLTEKFDPAFSSLLSRFDSAMGSGFPSEALNRVAESNSNPLALLQGFIKNKLFLRPHEVQRIVLVSSGKRDLADKLEKERTVISGDPQPCMKHLMSEVPDMSSLSSLPSDIRSSRTMEPGNIRKIIIRMVMDPNIKQAGETVPVMISDDFKYLSGPQEIQSAPNILDDPMGALKTYLALGSIVAAFSSVLGKEISPKLLGGAGIMSALSGPALMAMLEDIPNAVNAPVQEMQLLNPNNPELVERALLSALASVNLQNMDKTGSVKTALINRANFGLKSLMALPLAYGASKIISGEAKKNALDDAAYTGKYDPGFMTKSHYTFPLSLALLLKFAHVDKKAKEYVKTAHAKMGGLLNQTYKKDAKEFYRLMAGFLFK